MRAKFINLDNCAVSFLSRRDISEMLTLVGTGPSTFAGTTIVSAIGINAIKYFVNRQKNIATDHGILVEQNTLALCLLALFHLRLILTIIIQ